MHEEMENMFVRHLRTAIITLAVFTLLTGLIYPLAITGLAQVLFPAQANGSLIREHGKIIGSALIGQQFTGPKYFWSRPSATEPYPYNAAASSGANYGPMNPVFLAKVKARVARLKKADPGYKHPIPADLVTSSGSGLDPEISIASALYQLPRVAEARHMSVKEVRSLIRKYTEGRFLGLLGEPGVNVLKLNLALDRAQSQQDSTTSTPASANLKSEK